MTGETQRLELWNAALCSFFTTITLLSNAGCLQPSYYFITIPSDFSELYAESILIGNFQSLLSAPCNRQFGATQEHTVNISDRMAATSHYPCNDNESRHAHVHPGVKHKSLCVVLLDCP